MRRIFSSTPLSLPAVALEPQLLWLLDYSNIRSDDPFIRHAEIPSMGSPAPIRVLGNYFSADGFYCSEDSIMKGRYCELCRWSPWGV